MFVPTAEERVPAGRGPLGSPIAYALAVVVTVAAILSPYALPQNVPVLRPLYLSFVGRLFVVYGVPILAFALLVGRRPVDRAVRGTGRAFAPSFAWFGALSLLALLVLVVLELVYLVLDPGALDLLAKPNPALSDAAANPWFWIGFSFVIGAVEETIFRGWIFGYWLARGSPNLGWHAVWTSALFAGVHLYYGQTYLAAAPFSYSTLFLLGLSFALAVRAGRGNLVWVALLHGANDAAAFLTLVSGPAGYAAHYSLVLAGAALALALYLRSRPSPPPPAAYAAPSMPPYAVSVVPPPPPPLPPPPPAPPPDAGSGPPTGT